MKGASLPVRPLRPPADWRFHSANEVLGEASVLPASPIYMQVFIDQRQQRLAEDALYSR